MSPMALVESFAAPEAQVRPRLCALLQEYMTFHASIAEGTWPISPLERSLERHQALAGLPCLQLW